MTSTQNLYQIFLSHPLISTDTRKIASGSLFFSLKGEKFNANMFAEKAIEAGAAYAIIDEAEYRLTEQYILVNDALSALQNLARYHREQLTIPVIGLTGTNGKTTTRELIYSVLSQRYKTVATQGNLNNHIGVPLTILSINPSHEVAVIEMGANHQKEIEFLCTISQPTHGLITNIGKAHLEGFGGIEGVKKGKGELYDFIKKSESPKVRKSERKTTASIAFVDSDNDILLKMQHDRNLKKVVYYGTGEGDNLVTGKLVENAPYLLLEWVNRRSGDSYDTKTQLTGAYNLDNVLAAICMGVYFGVPDEAINKGIEDYQPKNNRSQIVTTASNTLICDYYNANPSSMFAAIENVGAVAAQRKVLILGDMFEMGQESMHEHQSVITKALETKVDEAIFIGKDFLSAGKSLNLAPSVNASFYETAGDAMEALKADPIKNATILIKGSRGMALERLAELF